MDDFDIETILALEPEELDKVIKNKHAKNKQAIEKEEVTGMKINIPSWIDWLFFNPQKLREVITHPPEKYNYKGITDRGGFYEIILEDILDYKKVPEVVSSTMNMACNSGYDLFIQYFFLMFLGRYREMQKIVEIQLITHKKEKDAEFMKTKFAPYIDKLINVMFQTAAFNIDNSVSLMYFVIVDCHEYWIGRDDKKMEMLERYKQKQNKTAHKLLAATNEEKKHRKHKHQKLRNEDRIKNERSTDYGYSITSIKEYSNIIFNF